MKKNTNTWKCWRLTNRLVMEQNYIWGSIINPIKSNFSNHTNIIIYMRY